VVFEGIERVRGLERPDRLAPIDLLQDGEGEAAAHIEVPWGSGFMGS
jgi:hypothetical protein